MVVHPQVHFPAPPQTKQSKTRKLAHTHTNTATTRARKIQTAYPLCQAERQQTALTRCRHDALGLPSNHDPVLQGGPSWRLTLKSDLTESSLRPPRPSAAVPSADTPVPWLRGTVPRRSHTPLPSLRWSIKLTPVLTLKSKLPSGRKTLWTDSTAPLHPAASRLALPYKPSSSGTWQHCSAECGSPARVCTDPPAVCRGCGASAATSVLLTFVILPCHSGRFTATTHLQWALILPRCARWRWGLLTSPGRRGRTEKGPPQLQPA